MKMWNLRKKYDLFHCQFALQSIMFAQFLKKSNKISLNIGLQNFTGYNYECIAESYLEKRDLKRALDFCNRAFDLLKEIGDKDGIGYARRVFGRIYKSQGKWEDSNENFEESIKIYNEIGMKDSLAETHFEFGLMWKAKGDVDKAREHFNKALNIFEKLKYEKKEDTVKAALEGLKDDYKIASGKVNYWQ